MLTACWNAQQKRSLLKTQDNRTTSTLYKLALKEQTTKGHCAFKENMETFQVRLTSGKRPYLSLYVILTLVPKNDSKLNFIPINLMK